MSDELADELRRTILALDALVKAGARIKIEDGGDGMPFAAQIQIDSGTPSARGYRAQGATRDMAMIALGVLLRKHGEITDEEQG